MLRRTLTNPSLLLPFMGAVLIAGALQIEQAYRFAYEGYLYKGSELLYSLGSHAAWILLVGMNMVFIAIFVWIDWLTDRLRPDVSGQSQNGWSYFLRGLHLLGGGLLVLLTLIIFAVDSRPSSYEFSIMNDMLGSATPRTLGILLHTGVGSLAIFISIWWTMRRFFFVLCLATLIIGGTQIIVTSNYSPFPVSGWIIGSLILIFGVSGLWATLRGYSFAEPESSSVD